MKLFIKGLMNGGFEVHPQDPTGMCKVGRGSTLKKALGDFLILYQKELGIEHVEMNTMALKAEQKRREKELNKR